MEKYRCEDLYNFLLLTKVKLGQFCGLDIYRNK